MTMQVTAIRITDPYIIELVEKQQASRGDKSATKTASRLITERIAQMEVISAPVERSRNKRRPRRRSVSSPT